MPTIEDHLRGRPEPVEVIAKGVVLHGSRRIFAGLVPRDRGLRGMLTKRIWHHRFFPTDPRGLLMGDSR